MAARMDQPLPRSLAESQAVLPCASTSMSAAGQGGSFSQPPPPPPPTTTSFNVNFDYEQFDIDVGDWMAEE